MFEFARFAWFALPSLALLTAPATKFATAGEGEGSPLPEAVQRIVPWLPEDTETVLAAQAFTMPGPAGDDDGERESFPMNLKQMKEIVCRWSALEGLAELDRGKYLKPLAGRKVVLALRGGRNFEPVSAFGHWRSEGCAVVVFENDLGEAAARWTAMLREGAREVRQIAGREVFVFPGTPSMRPARWPKPWLGVYLVLLKPDTILCATSDRFLEELLTRVDAPTPKRALPADLPEWKHVNPTAPVWMLRHIPGKNRNEEGDGPSLTGVTWTLTEERLRVNLLPSANSANEVEREARRRWIPVETGVQPKIVRQGDGTVTISSASGDLSEFEGFVFTLGLDNLAGIRDYREGR